ncbi:DUF4178 domain-containing protein [Methyloversatilis discipulorum]|uniref:DUF4178 domain-containing protein n=1 Tax=Methyloversatilis discipulorum TaxID=1119528 RepID=UPI001A576B15|nr:DUF4178 domain-containing protein [Methyloversatilis discipulorum]MBL8469704.1 DUF4178 domain-containing protein [Methyloversatilis discipulorum]
MAMYQAACPGCGAPVEFRSAASRMAVCCYCRTTLLRDADAVRDIGKQAALIEDHSPVQIMTSGQRAGQGFTVVGRIQLRYEHGVWNEWYLLFDDGSGGWLGDFGGQFVLTRPDGDAVGPPLFDKVEPGNRWSHGGTFWHAADIRKAECVAAEGELPFPVDARWVARVIDYRHRDEFLTLDYSDLPPVVYRGRAVTLAAVRAQHLRDADAVVSAAGRLHGGVSTLICPVCGAPAAVVPGATQHLTCPSCRSQISLAAGQAEVVQREVADVTAVGATLQAGETLTIDGVAWRLMGWMCCGVPGDASEPDWYEYLLFAPMHGFQWLIETQEGWQQAQVLDDWPESFTDTSVELRGLRYTRRYLYRAEVRAVVGAFPWCARVGDRTEIGEYVSGKWVLNLERGAHEMGWSQARPVETDTVASWAGRKLATIARGRRAAEVAPSGGGKAALRPVAWVFTVLIVVMNLRYMLPFNVDAMMVTGVLVFLLWIPTQSGDEGEG